MSRRRTFLPGRKKAPDHRTAEDAWDQLIHVLALEDAENGDREDTAETRRWAQRLAEQARAQVAEQLLGEQRRRPRSPSREARPALSSAPDDVVQAADTELRLVALPLEGQRPPTN
jgi:hypothetical protein